MKKTSALIIGTFVMASGLQLFLIPANIAAGGVSGIATILQNTVGIKASVTVFLLNIPLLISAYLFCGKKLFVNSLLGSALLSLFLEVLSGVTPMVEDRILNAVAGGVLVGLGQGIVFRFDATTGGTDILATLLQKAKPHLAIGILVLVADGMVILASGLTFKNFEIMICAAISLFIASRVIDSIVVGLDFEKEVTIISPFVPDIARDIAVTLDRGSTGVKCLGMYSGKERMMLISVVKKNQIVKLKNIVQKYDKKAFVIVSEVKEVIGEGFKIE